MTKMTSMVHIAKRGFWFCVELGECGGMVIGLRPDAGDATVILPTVSQSRTHCLFHTCVYTFFFAGVGRDGDTEGLGEEEIRKRGEGADTGATKRQGMRYAIAYG